MLAVARLARSVKWIGPYFHVAGLQFLLRLANSFAGLCIHFLVGFGVVHGVDDNGVQGGNDSAHKSTSKSGETPPFKWFCWHLVDPVAA